MNGCAEQKPVRKRLYAVDMTSDESSRDPLELLLSFQSRAWREAADTARRVGVAWERAEDMMEVDVGETPSEVVYRENKLELLQYDSLTEEQSPVPVLVVYALINRPYIMDLQPDRSIVRRLLEAGHDVYLIDWHEPSRLDTSLALHDYVNRYIDNCVDVVRDRSGRDSINILGYCMGGTMSAVYAALYPGKVNALGLMAAGLYFEETGGVLELWGDDDYYDPTEITDAYGNAPGDFLAAGFALMDPVDNYFSKYVGLLDRIENEDFVRNFARMERWLADSVDVAGEVYREFVEDIYQDNKLYRNELVVGERVDLANVDMPVLQILGQYDTLVPPDASKPFNDVVGSDDVTTIEYPSGHVGLAMSTEAHRDVWPEVAEWYLEKSGQPSLADVIGEGVEEALEVDVETDVTRGDFDEVMVGVARPDREVARAVVARDAGSIREFLEEELGVEIRVGETDEGISVEVVTDEGVTTTTTDVGAAIRSEVRESVEDVDVAEAHELEDVDGVGPTYAGRLRDAGIESPSELAEAEEGRIADAIQESRGLARKLIGNAGRLVGENRGVN